MNKIPLFSLKGVEYLCYNDYKVFIKKFEIHKGIVYGIGGKPGSGKTVLIDILSKQIKPSIGTIEYDGKPFHKLTNKNYKNQFALVPQKFKTPYFATVEDYILKYFSKYDHIGSVEKRMNSICRRMEIPESITKLKMKYLSPGQLRWVLLACGIGADTKVLLIDEIEQHLPNDQLNLVLKILYKKCNYDGVTMIISTQRIDILKKIGSIFVNLEKGKITSVRSPGRKVNRRSGKSTYKDKKIRNKKD
tara:strand:- start:2957 stop:3697 length:741 start_codon:yes stop_codon:yes gene_type:complete